MHTTQCGSADRIAIRHDGVTIARRHMAFVVSRHDELTREVLQKRAYRYMPVEQYLKSKATNTYLATVWAHSLLAQYYDRHQMHHFCWYLSLGCH